MHAGERPDRPDFAIGPVMAIAIAVTVGLLLLSPWHGFHRDELYFIIAGQHPQFGYPDQPPLTPLLSAAMTSLLGVEPFVVRILPALVSGMSVVVVPFATSISVAAFSGGAGFFGALLQAPSANTTSTTSANDRKERGIWTVSCSSATRGREPRDGYGEPTLPEREAAL